MNFLLEAKSREIGKGSDITALKDQGQVPGVIYGPQEKAQSLAVGYNELIKILNQAGTSHIINLKLDDQDMRAIVRDYQQDPVSDKVIHVDFLQIADDRPIMTKVPLKFVGESVGVKEHGGKLDIKNDQVKVKCLPLDLPEAIEVDISGLVDLNQSILIKDLIVSDQVVILNNPNDPVVAVIVPKKLEVATETVASPVEGAEAKEGEQGAEAKEGEESAEK